MAPVSMFISHVPVVSLQMYPGCVQMGWPETHFPSGEHTSIPLHATPSAQCVALVQFVQLRKRGLQNSGSAQIQVDGSAFVHVPSTHCSTPVQGVKSEQSALERHVVGRQVSMTALQYAPATHMLGSSEQPVKAKHIPVLFPRSMHWT